MRVCFAPVLALAVAACVTPTRHALPAPFPLTMGALPVPANGLGLSFELNDGLRGQEVERTEIIASGLLAGGGDALSVGAHVYDETRDDGESGVFFRLKAALARPFAGRGIVALHAATALTSRRDGATQDEALTAVDLALPVALRVDSGSGDKSFVVAVFLGGDPPVFQHYLGT